MANEGAVIGLIALLLLGSGRREIAAQQLDSRVSDGLPPTVSLKDATGATPVPPTTLRTVPNPTTNSTATVSPLPDVVGPRLSDFSDLPDDVNGVITGASPEFAEAFTAGTILVNVPIPGAGYQLVRILRYWTTRAEAEQALADAQLQQQTYPLGDPLWVHYEAVKIATRLEITPATEGLNAVMVLLPRADALQSGRISPDQFHAEFTSWVGLPGGSVINAYLPFQEFYRKLFTTEWNSAEFLSAYAQAHGYS